MNECEEISKAAAKKAENKLPALKYMRHRKFIALPTKNFDVVLMTRRDK